MQKIGKVEKVNLSFKKVFLTLLNINYLNMKKSVGFLAFVLILMAVLVSGASSYGYSNSDDAVAIYEDATVEVVTLGTVVEYELDSYSKGGSYLVAYIEPNASALRFNADSEIVIQGFYSTIPTREKLVRNRGSPNSRIG